MKIISRNDARGVVQTFQAALEDLGYTGETAITCTDSETGEVTSVQVAFQDERPKAE